MPNIPILSTPVTYEPKVAAPFDKRSVFETLALLQAYDKAFLYQGWLGYVKDNNYHAGVSGKILTYDGTSFVGLNSDTIDGNHAYGTPVGDFGTMVDTTNIIEYISKLRSLIKNIDDTDDVPEGLFNLYFTQPRVLATLLTGFTTTSIPNNTVLNTDTLLTGIEKLQVQLNNKEPLSTSGTTTQYRRGDKTWQTLNTSVVTEGTNLYYTNARTIASTLTAFSSTTGSITSADTVLSAIQKIVGNTASYVLTSDSRLTDARIASDVYAWAKATVKPTYTYTEVGAAPTSHTHLTSAITALTGYALGTDGTALSTTDSLNVALGKIQVQLNNKQNTGSYEPLITKSTGYAKYVSGAWTFVNETYSLSTHNHTGVYQPVGNYVLTTDNRLSDARTPLPHVHYQLFKPDGSASTVYVDAAGKLHVDADIINNGGVYKTYTEEIYSDSDYITMRNGAVAGLATGTYSGFLIKKYDGTNDGRLVVGSDGIARVGDVGAEQAIATRVNSPTNGYLAYWDDANTQLNFKTLSKVDVGLGNVDNTADINKNVLTATKLNSAKTFALTGDISASVSSDLSSGLSLATTLSTSALLAKLLTGYTLGSNTALSTSDSLLIAFGKIQAQLNGKQSSGNYEPLITKSTGYAKYVSGAWSFVNESYSLNTHNHTGVYQPVGNYLDDTDLSKLCRTAGNSSFGGTMIGITTADFVTYLTTLDVFKSGYWINRGSWSYASNYYITDAPDVIQLAGATVEVIGAPLNHTIRIHTASTISSGIGAVPNCDYIYINNGVSYSPGWRKLWNSKNLNPSSYSLIGHSHTEYQPVGSYLTTSDLTGLQYGNKIGASSYYTSSQIFIPFFKFGSEITNDGNYVKGTFISTRGATKIGIGNNPSTIIDVFAKNSIWRAGSNDIRAYFNIQICPDSDPTPYYFATALVNGELWFGLRWYNFQDYSLYFIGESSNVLSTIPYKKTYNGDVIYNSEVNDSILKYSINPHYFRNGYKVWNESNDGTGSGLDADLLDGKHASDFALTSHMHSYLSLSGGSMLNSTLVNELNAEYLDGHTYLDFAPTVHTHPYLSLDGGTMNNTNVITSLNADLLDGNHASEFSLSSHNHNGVYEPAFTSGTTSQYRRGDKTWQTLDKIAIGLSNVENTALSTWVGSSNITTIGTLPNLNIATTAFKYINTEIQLTSQDYRRAVILLHPVYDGTNPLANNYCIGKFIGQRGGTINSNRRYVIDVNTATAYNTSLYSIDSSIERGTLATTMYNGVKYMCLVLPYIASRITAISFEGYINSTAVEKLKFIEYYNSQTSTVLNEEINSSLTNVINFKDRWLDLNNLYVNGNKVWNEGNDGAGSTLDADLLDGLEASAFSLSTHTHSSLYQPLDADLTAIAALLGTSGFLKKTASDTWTLDTTTYLPISGGTLSGLLTLSSDPVTSLHAATKQYVDNAVQGITIYTPCKLSTTGSNITLSGGTPSTLDGVSLVLNDRVLVKDQTDKTTNGLYVVTTVGTGSNGTWTRATDADTSAEVKSGAFVLVTNGNTLAGNGYSITTPAPITLGTSQLIFTQYSQAGTYIAGTGLTKTGNTFAINATVSTASNTLTFTNKTWNGGTIAIGYGGTGATTKTTAFNALSPLSTLGDIIYHDGTNNVRLAGNTTTSLKVLGSTGNGTISAIPTWTILTKSTIGLDNVDNTSDVNKPISSATQVALDNKEVVIPTGLITQYYAGDKSWKLLDKAAVGLNLVDNTSDLSKMVLSASKLSQSIQFALTGAITGSTTSDLSTNISISTSISDTTVVSKLLTGYTIGSNSSLVSTDSILAAFGKLEAKVNAKVASVGANLPLYISGGATNPTITMYAASSNQSGYMTPTQYRWYNREKTYAQLSDNTFTIDWSAASKQRMNLTTNGAITLTNVSIGELSLEVYVNSAINVTLPTGWWVNGYLLQGVNVITFQYFDSGFAAINIASYEQI